MLLKKGSSGTDVTKCQILLWTPTVPLAVDGIFGSATEQAVKEFQEVNGFAPDGLVNDKIFDRFHKWKVLKDIPYFQHVKLAPLKLKVTSSPQMNTSIKNYGGLCAPLSSFLKWEEAAIHAIVATESAGAGFKNGKLVIRFEVHHFKEHLKDNVIFDKYFSYNKSKVWTDHKVKLSKSWSDVHLSQESEWKTFEFARTLNESAAIKSISMGAGQMLGRYFSRLGYESPLQMFEKMTEDQRWHILGMFDFIKTNVSLVDAMNTLNFYKFAYHYNGSGQPDVYSKWMKERYDAWK
jgi:hypothetical protein